MIHPRDPDVAFVAEHAPDLLGLRCFWLSPLHSRGWLAAAHRHGLFCALSQKRRHSMCSHTGSPSSSSNSAALPSATSPSIVFSMGSGEVFADASADASHGSTEEASAKSTSTF